MIQAFDTNVIYSITDGIISKLKIEIDRSSKNPTSYVSKLPELDAVFVNYPEKVMKKFKKKELKTDSTHYWLEDEPYFNPFHVGKVVFCAGKYWLNGGMLGKDLEVGETVMLDDNGVIQGNPECKGDVSPYHFWNGWLCLSEKSLDTITALVPNKNSALYKSYVDQKEGKVYDLDWLVKHLQGLIFNYKVTGGW